MNNCSTCRVLTENNGFLSKAQKDDKVFEMLHELFHEHLRSHSFHGERAMYVFNCSVDGHEISTTDIDSYNKRLCVQHQMTSQKQQKPTKI